MANPTYGTFPNAFGWQGISSRVKIGLATNRNNEADAAAQVNLNGRFDWVNRVYRGDLLSPQFYMRPILRRVAQGTAPGTPPIRWGVVSETGPAISAASSSLEKVRNNVR
jgi:hypothetical protein